MRVVRGIEESGKDTSLQVCGLSNAVAHHRRLAWICVNLAISTESPSLARGGSGRWPPRLGADPAMRGRRYGFRPRFSPLAGRCCLPWCRSTVATQAAPQSSSALCPMQARRSSRLATSDRSVGSEAAGPSRPRMYSSRSLGTPCQKKSPLIAGSLGRDQQSLQSGPAHHLQALKILGNRAEPVQEH